MSLSGAYFSRRLLKAIDSWQAGSVGKNKKAKQIASILKSEPVDSYYTSCGEVCFRRSVIAKQTIKQLFFDFQLPEETSSWTTRSDVAASFKGGPPDPPTPGIIFRHQPKPNEVILNLSRLMTHEKFWPSVEYWETEGSDFGKGLRKWAATQHEVILKVASVPHNEFYALGSNAAQSVLGGAVGDGVKIIGDTPLTVNEISSAFTDAGLATKKWIFDESAKRAYENWVKRVLTRLEV